MDTLHPGDLDRFRDILKLMMVKLICHHPAGLLIIEQDLAWVKQHGQDLLEEGDQADLDEVENEPRGMFLH